MTAMRIDQYSFTVTPENPSKLYDGENKVSKISFTVRGKKWVHSKTISDMTDPFQPRPINSRKKIGDGYIIQQDKNRITLLPDPNKNKKVMTVNGNVVTVLDNFFPSEQPQQKRTRKIRNG